MFKNGSSTIRHSYNYFRRPGPIFSEVIHILAEEGLSLLGRRGLSLQEGGCGGGGEPMGNNGEKLPIVKCFPHKILSPFFPIFPHPCADFLLNVFRSFFNGENGEKCFPHKILSPFFPIFPHPCADFLLNVFRSFFC